MSISRGNWSTLSRLAQQWAEDDEEEQIRERRRRNRDLSAGNRVVEISETDSPENKSNALNKTQTEVFQNANTKETEIPEQQHEKNKITCNNVEESKESTCKPQEVERLNRVMRETQRVTPKKEQSQSYACTRNDLHKQNEIKPSNSQVESNNKTHNVEQPKSTTQEAQRVTTKKEKSQNLISMRKYAYEHREDKTPKSQVASTVKLRKVEQPKNEIQEAQKEEGAKKDERHNHTCSQNDTHEHKEDKISNNQKENIFAKNHQCQDPEVENRTLQHQHNDIKTDQKSGSCEKGDHAEKTQRTQLQETSPPNNDIKQVQDQPKLRRSSSSTLTVSVNTTPIQTQNEKNMSPTDGSQSKFKTQVFVSSVKIPRRSDSGIKSPPPVTDVIEEESSTKGLKSEVFIPALSSTSQDNKHESHSSSQPTSSSFVRLGRLTSSVRMKSPSEDDNGFVRSSSLRFSLRSRKIEDRMEKYTSAIQKSASVRIPGSQSRAGIGALDGIANKKSVFEREEDHPTANSSQRDLTLPGSVTSRINQWSSKMQQSSSSVTGTKDIRTGDVATKRKLWQQRSQSSNDTKL